MATVIGYKGMIFINGLKEGVDLSEEGLKKEDLTDALINDPLKPGQLGFVCELNKCKFNEAAKSLLMKIERSRDDIGNVDVFESVKGSVFAWLGGPMVVIDPEASEGSDTYSYETIEKIVPVEIDIPEDIKEFMEEK